MDVNKITEFLFLRETHQILIESKNIHLQALQAKQKDIKIMSAIQKIEQDIKILTPFMREASRECIKNLESEIGLKFKYLSTDIPEDVN